jgi:murein DD-endopeptidase MepM/ murein hydrolase activator NlpD
MRTTALLLLLLASCSPDSKPATIRELADPVMAATEAKDDLESYLDAPFPPADGFDFPFGDGDGGGSYTDLETGRKHSGWYVATHFAEKYSLGIHPGEDWNGEGGGNTDYGQPVRSVASGRVVSARNHGKLWGNVIVIEHLFYENNLRRTVHSVYAHLSAIDVKPGAKVGRRTRIGAIGRDPDGLYSAHLHLEIRSDTSLDPTYWPSSHQKDIDWVGEHYIEPTEFIRSHRSLPVPQMEKTLVVVDQESYRMRLYEKGKMVEELSISLGQSKGRKRLQGDNRTPKGMYFVIAHERGDIPGTYGGYYGGHWIKINYPNRYDAAYGRSEGLIDASREREIAKLWEARKGTVESTRLGGGIGFHGWIKEWSDDGPRHLSWGCVVMHIRDIKRLYDRIPIGTMVVIL